MECDADVKGAFSAKFKGKPVNVSSSKKKKEIICFRCYSKGYFAYQCPNKLKDKGNKLENSEKSKEHVYCAAYMSGKFNNKDWYVDAVASAYIPNSQQRLNVKYQNEIIII